MFKTSSSLLVLSPQVLVVALSFGACTTQSGSPFDNNTAAGGATAQSSGRGGNSAIGGSSGSTLTPAASGGAIHVSLGTTESTGGATVIPWPPTPDYINVTNVTSGAYALGPDISDGNVPLNTGVTCSGMLFGTLRDFKMGNVAEGHPDFETAPDSTRQGGVKGIVASTLGDDGKPVFADPTDALAGTTGRENFEQWYHDAPDINKTFIVAMKLDFANGVSTFSASAGSGKGAINSSYFPLDDAGFGNEEQAHNFAFTTEIHTAFIYNGGETFTFMGDDDIWVFIDKQLVIDLGGRHGQLTGSVALDTLGLKLGGTYNLDVFNAERHTTQSNFRIDTTLTLANCGRIDQVIL